MPRPAEHRSCACGCGATFITRNPARRYHHPTHRPARRPHYTAAELQQRTILLAHPPQGDPCPRCGQPMWPTQHLHTGHIIDRVLGGTGHGFRWEHAHCNTSAGATLGNTLRNTPTRDW